MRNTNSILNYRDVRAKRPALRSTRGAAVAAWKTSTASTLHHQENTWHSSHRGFEESHGTLPRQEQPVSLQCLLSEDAQTMGSPRHSLPNTPLALQASEDRPLHGSGTLNPYSKSTPGWTSSAPPRAELPVHTASFLSVIADGKTRTKLAEFPRATLVQGALLFLPICLGKAAQILRIEPTLLFPTGTKFPLRVYKLFSQEK